MESIKTLETTLAELKKQPCRIERSSGQRYPYLERDNVIAIMENAIASNKLLDPVYRRCKKCSSPRKGDVCHKCGDPTFIPCDQWDEPALPPIDRIRELAREVGYAIAVHGTLERDLDLIAAPWTNEAISAAELINHITVGLGGRIVEIEQKPLGRYAATIQMDGWFKNIDLSVCPGIDNLSKV